MSPAAGSAARSRVASAVRRARPATPSPRPRLTLLAPPASTRFRLPFAALCAAVLVASLLGVLVINIVLSRGAYTEHVLENRQIELTETEQHLSERLAVQASPAVLSERAQGLGMVPNVNPAFIRMSDGTVLGSPAPAEAGTTPLAASIPAAGLDVVPEAPPAAEEAAAAAAQEQAATAQAEAARLAAEEAAATAAAATAEERAAVVGDGAVAPRDGGDPVTITGPVRRPTRATTPRARPATGAARPTAARPTGTRAAAGTAAVPAARRAPEPSVRRTTSGAPPAARGRPDPRPATHDRRARGFVLLVLVVLSLFAARLVQMQGLDASTLAGEALGNRLVTTTLVADRGQITDADGVVLASNVERRTITVDQTLVAQYTGSTEGSGRAGIEGAAADIAAVTGQDPTAVAFALTGDKRFAYVAKEVTPEVWREVQQLKVPGVYSQKTSVRTYPAGAVAGNLVGFTSSEGDGQAGLEGSLDDVLAGTDGSRNFERGRDGQMIPTGDMAEVPAVDGRNVRLTLDRDLQWYAQQRVAAQVAESEAEWGVVYVKEVETGNILALAESPSVDPNDPGAAPAEDRGSRALSDVFEPGSTAKVVTAAAVLEEGLVEPTTQFEVPYRYTTENGQTFKDSHEHGVEQRTFAGVLAESSNTGTVQAGQQLSKQQRYDYLTRFGFGQPTGLDFPGESRGILAQPEDWDGRQQYAVLFGQGVSTNALQAVDVFATIGNDGVRMAPRLVDGVAGEDGLFEEAPAAEATPVVSPETAAAVRSMLESAVDEGTGGNAAIPGYRIAGKTGTAQAPGPGGYSGYTGSFIGLAPADDPKLVVGVIIQRPTNGYYGGTVAAPVFKDVMSFALQDLGVPPTQTTPTPYPLTWE